MSQSSQSVVCPLCRKTDDIRKVSTIVAQGTSTYNRPGYQIPSQNLLTHYLKPPSPPLLKSVHPTPWIFVLALLLLLGIWSIIGLIAFIIFLIQANGSITTSSLLIDLVDTEHVDVGIRMLLGMEILVILLFLLHAYRGAARKAKQASLQQENDQQGGRWKQAMDRWNNLYYCYRDDVVFLPGPSQKSVQPTSMYSLL